MLIGSLTAGAIIAENGFEVEVRASWPIDAEQGSSRGPTTGGSE